MFCSMLVTIHKDVLSPAMETYKTVVLFDGSPYSKKPIGEKQDQDFDEANKRLYGDPDSKFSDLISETEPPYKSEKKKKKKKGIIF